MERNVSKTQCSKSNERKETMKKRVLALTLTFSMVFTMLNAAFAVSPADFSDMPNDWSRGAIERAIENGLLSGANGRINASGKLTRAEMAAIIVRAFGATQAADLSAFSDVSSSDWYYDAMQKAVGMGVLSGSNRKLNPDAFITREEVCAVLHRAFLLEDGGAAAQKFHDFDRISDWAKEAVSAMAAKGFIAGDSAGNVSAGNTITRAEFAQMMDNLVKGYPSGTAGGVIDGNAVVKAGGVLSGVTVKGDLILADGIGRDSIDLSGVMVEGRILVRGGSEVKLSGSTTAESIAVAASAAVRNDTGRKFTNISIEGSSANVTFTGAFGTVEVKADGVTVRADSSASIDQVTTAVGGTTVEGSGTVKAVNVQAGASGTKVTTQNTGITVAPGAGRVGSVNGSLEPGETGATDGLGRLEAEIKSDGQETDNTKKESNRPSGGRPSGGSNRTAYTVSGADGQPIGSFDSGTVLTVDPANGDRTYTVAVNGPVTLETPIRSGYVFAGWMVSGTAITARWTKRAGALSLNWETYAMACGRSLEEGETLTLEASFSSGGYTAPEVRWHSSDPSVVAIKDDAGESVIVQARTNGIVDITASLYDGERLIDSAVCRIVSVDGYDHTTMQRLRLSADRLTLQKDAGPTVLTPIFFPVDIPADGTMDTSLEIVDGYDSSVIAVSLNEDQPYTDYADIGNLARGDCQILYDQVVVTPVGAGETTFTVRSAYNGRAASCTVTVTDEALAVTGLVGGSEDVITLTVGKNGENTRQLHVIPTGGTSDIIWSSSNPHIAAVDANGLVTAHSTSNYEERATNSSALDANDSNYKTVTITATSVQGGFTQEFKVMVLPQATRVTGISVNAERLSLAAGTHSELYAAVNPASILSPDVRWSSSNERVVRVESTEDNVFGAPSARLTAVAPGTAAVTAFYEGVSASCTVTVTNGEVPVSEITINGPDTLVRDQVAALTARVTANATNPKLLWLSDNRTVVTVDREGNLQGYDAGTAHIYAIAMDSLTDEQKETLYFTADMELTGDDQAPTDELCEIRNISADPAAKEKLETLLNAGNTVYAAYEVEVDGTASPYLRNLHIPEETITDRSVVLAWNRDSLYSVADLEGTEVRVNGRTVVELDTEMSYTVRDLSPSTSYTFEVETHYGDGQSVTETVTARTDAAPVRVLNVMEYGAVGDGSTLDTAAIQAAIDDCPAGGEVWMPEGRIFYSGALFLKSNMTLRVDGILLGSPDPKDYPRIVSRWEGWRRIYQAADEWLNENERTGRENIGKDNEYVYSSLLTVGVYDEGENGYTAPYNVENVTICGSGQINANGYRLGYNEGPNSAVKGGGNGIDYSLCRQNPNIRGHVLVTHNVCGMYVADVMLANGPAWTIDAIYSKNVTFDNIAVVALSNYKTNVGSNRNYILNGDGLDVDSSTHVNILNSFFRAGDDAIAAKSGKNVEGWLRGKPTAYLRVSDVFSLGSRYGLIIGSEMAGGAHDILFLNSEFVDNVSDNSMWIKAPIDRGGLVEDITHRDIFNNSRQAAIKTQTAYSTKLGASASPIYTRIRRLTYENITEKSGGKGSACMFNGNQYSTIRDVVIRGFQSEVKLSYVDGMQLTETGGYTIDTKSGGTEQNVTNVTVQSAAAEADIGLKLAAGAADVKAIDLEDAAIDVRKGTTVEQLLVQLMPEGSETDGQKWIIADETGTEKAGSAALDHGDQLTVAMKNGTGRKAYTVRFYKADEIAASTVVEAIGSETVKKLSGSSLEVCAAATVADLLEELRSELGGALTLSVNDGEGAPMDEDDELVTGCTLHVVAEDGDTAADYVITVQGTKAPDADAAEEETVSEKKDPPAGTDPATEIPSGEPSVSEESGSGTDGDETYAGDTPTVTAPETAQQETA